MTTSNNNQLRRRLLQGAVAAWTLSISRVGFAASVQMIAIRIWPASAYTRVTLESNTELKYRSFMLSHPDRIVVDLTDVQLNSVLAHMGKIQPDDPFLKQVRVGQFDKSTVRLVFELKQRIRSNLFALKPVAGFKDRLVMDLYPLKYNISEADDPLLTLLEDYNKGDVDRRLPSKASPKPGKAGKDRPVVVVLDPGHGGEDPGAIGKNKTREKDVVLQIAQRLCELLKREPGMQVWMTRNEDIFIPLKVRVAEARRRQADLFISIHADAFTNRAAKGSSVFALSVRGATSNLARFLAQTQNEADDIGGVSRSGDKYLDSTMFDLLQTATISDSLKFGQAILQQMKKINSLHKHHVEQAGFAVLKAPDIPSILVETAFISNPEEEYRLRTRHFQQQIAMSILAGIKDHFSHGSGK